MSVLKFVSIWAGAALAMTLASFVFLSAVTVLAKLAATSQWSPMAIASVFAGVVIGAAVAAKVYREGIL